MKKINLILFYAISSLVAFDKKSFDVSDHQDVKDLLEKGFNIGYVGAPAIDSNGHQTTIVVNVEMVDGLDGRTSLDKLMAEITPEAEDIFKILLPTWKKAAEEFKERFKNPKEYEPVAFHAMTEEDRAKMEQDIAEFETAVKKFQAGTLTEEEKNKYLENYFRGSYMGGFRKESQKPGKKTTTKPGTKKDNPKA